MLGEPAARKTIAVSAVLLAFVTGCSHGDAAQPVQPESSRAAPAPVVAPAPAPPPPPPTLPPVEPSPYDFGTVSTLIDDAIADNGLPGAVVQIGHGGKVVFRKAYGQRKLDGEPGLNAAPAPAEPMTEDTIFDIASLTKVLATAPAVVQLYEQGKLQFDDPVQKYLPDFNPANDPQRAQVTLRMLLTHTSGLPGDVDLKDPWGLQQIDRPEGFRRALTTPLESPPGVGVRYSDINFILLGLLVEKLTGEQLDDYVQRNVFGPIGLAETRYLPAAKACGPHSMRGAAVAWEPPSAEGASAGCAPGMWNMSLMPRIAPTSRDEENRGDPGRNPDIDYLLRGTVNDTTARRMGGVAGHAGVFSTAHEVGMYAQSLLDRLAGRQSAYPLTQETLQMMTSPQQPGADAGQIEAANAAEQEAGRNATDPLLARHYPAIRGQNLRGFGWDIDTGQSMPRGRVFPIGSFGHTGFTGTSVWIDPASDTYVVLLTNSIHTRGSPPASKLRGDVATAAAQALGL
jgi:CubicO group peptidase (beta-lactamase class C family)